MHLGENAKLRDYLSAGVVHTPVRSGLSLTGSGIDGRSVSCYGVGRVGQEIWEDLD